jgi:hypothetical protein
MPTTLVTSTTGAQQRFSLDSIDRATYFLRYNLEIFLQLYEYFIQNNLQAIVQYYANSANNPDRESFDFLQDLQTEMTKIKALYTLNKNSFHQVDDWELLDFLEGIDTKLQTISNTSKWTRSSATQNSWRGRVLQTTYTLQDGETLEQVSQIVYGDTNAQDDWTRIALENDLSEWGYNTTSNKAIKVTKQNASSPNYFLNSVVDNLINESLYGLDFNCKIGFVNNDLAILNYNDTFVQAARILIMLKKGDSPEFRAIGVDPKLAVGASFGSLKFSSIIRQLEEAFATDDTMRNFAVTNVAYNNGVLQISWQVDSFFNLTYGNTAVIQQQ